MTKLWEKGYAMDQVVENFTIGNDYLLDQKLVPYDCQASFAHARMLLSIGILTQSELDSLEIVLNKIISLWEKSEFKIEKSQEDCHTAIENYLTQHCGEAGKKIHTARSRNDQVLVALKLFALDEGHSVLKTTKKLVHEIAQFAQTHQNTPIPGRTHMQLAMPSSLGLWAGAMAESLLDDITLLEATLGIINQCPLGSASSYGVSLPTDRQMVSDELGFKKVQNNVLYCNNSRGKWESMLISSLTQVMLSCSKIASDLIFFSLPETAYLSLPQELCSGSSLMPQKRNPCALELIRAKTATVQGHLITVLEIIRPLISGYNRDFQETKGPLMYSLEITQGSLNVIQKTFEKLQVNPQKCLEAFKPELFATDWVLDLVAQGTPFREAYRQVAQNPQRAPCQNPLENIRAKTHLGAPGNLGLHEIEKNNV